MPLHIKRLIITFAVFIALFLVLKHYLTPKSFKEFGHYRGLAIGENEDRELKHVGSAMCANCHDVETNMKDSGSHHSIACEACHGPGYKHIEAPDSAKMFKPTKVREFCGKCHGQNAARPLSKIHQVDLKDHNTEYNCTKCHNPHQANKP